MNDTDYEKVAGLSIFQGLASDTIKRLCTPSFLQEFPAGARLLEQGRRAGFLFVLLDGSVEMSATAGDKRTVIEIIHPVGLFILAAVLNDDVHLQSSRTLTPSRVLMIPSAVIRDQMAADAAFMQAVVRELAYAYRRVVRELKSVKLHSGTERLALWVCEQAAFSGSPTNFKLPYEKRTLAAYMGMTPENLSRAFSNLVEHGVTVRSHQIEITDAREFADFCSALRG